MSQAEEQLNRVHEKLQHLLKRYQVLQKENEKLTQEVNTLKTESENNADRTKELELKLAALRATTSQMTEADRKELDKRLTRYLREIDRCIALLSE